MLTNDIKNKVQNMWDRLWAGGLSNPITAIEQISYLLFMKRLENFNPKVKKEYKWSVYHEYEGEQLTTHVKDKVFQYIKNDLAEKDEPFAKAMKDSVFLINTPSLLKDAIGYIDAIYLDIEKQEKDNKQYFQDIQGDIYEYLLRHTSEAGKNGQFRTPRHIIQMMAEILDPDTDGKICDLACGSSGFLVGAYQYIITKYSKQKVKDENGLDKGLDGENLSDKQKKDLKESVFYGFDVDQTMVRIGMMNLLMHGITHPNITHLDTLSKKYEDFEENQNLKEISDAVLSGKITTETSEVKDVKIKDIVATDNSSEKYKYILANPPFTGKINSETVSDNLDRIYPLVKNKKTNKLERQKTVQSELLFLERMIYMLEEGGRACVIVPEGLLFNSSSAHVKTRKILMEDCDLQGVISLPSGVFQPYTGVKTSILVFEKKKYRSEISQEIPIWFYDMKSDGYSLDANRKKLKANPLPKAIKNWKGRFKGNQLNRKLQHFLVPFEEIQKNKYELNLNKYKKFEYKGEDYRLPKDILNNLIELEDEILKGLNNLNYEGI